jgi:uncharacterized protein
LLELRTVSLDIPEGTNLILGQSHFIKSVEDLYEVLVSSVPGILFGLAFCEASGPRLVRCEGTADDLKEFATKSALQIAAGHSFVIYIRGAFPINVLNGVKSLSEVCQVFCATANPVQVMLGHTEQGNGILGVVDGSSPLGVETNADVEKRHEFLRKIGYKR